MGQRKKINDKQPNIRYAFGDPLYRWSFASVAVFPDPEARWLYETQLIPDPLRAHLNNVHFQLDGSGISNQEVRTSLRK